MTRSSHSGLKATAPLTRLSKSIVTAYHIDGFLYDVIARVALLSGESKCTEVRHSRAQSFVESLISEQLSGCLSNLVPGLC